MTPGDVFFDDRFTFHDGFKGRKLFVVLGTAGSISVVAKTTSRRHGKGNLHGCQPLDRFHNFCMAPGCSFFTMQTWVCLHEFYELRAAEVMAKVVDGHVRRMAVLDPMLFRSIQECALDSLDISPAQDAVVRACLV